MDAVSALPDRPLTRKHLFSLNDADALELAVPVGEDDREARGVLLATDAWLVALAFVDGWHVVERYDLSKTERIDALQAGEQAVEAAFNGEDDARAVEDDACAVDDGVGLDSDGGDPLDATDGSGTPN